MDILVVGGGGREHALVWKLKQSAKVKNILVAPGNAGTAKIATNLDLSKTTEIIAWLKKHQVDLVVVGPDNYLAEGIVDRIKDLGVPVFGPTKAAAEIEWSKSFAKQLMQEENIPTAAFQTFDNLQQARRYIKNQKFPVVIKADGLALGKGVVIAENLAAAETALQEMMANKQYGVAGRTVIIEEYLTGQEISIHVFCDGESIVMFPAAADHKRIFAGDRGPNTGGMGTVAPVPLVTPSQLKEIEEKIVLPTLAALKRRGRTFQGLLYPGIMMTANGPKVLEFNARFGDPETQSYLRLLDTDLVVILLACVNGTLKQQKIQWSKQFACCVVCAARGYPGKYEQGKVITGLNKVQNKDVVVFQAGTKSSGDKILTNGGRVLGVTATGLNLKEALVKSYRGLQSIAFDGLQYRKDIGARFDF